MKFNQGNDDYSEELHQLLKREKFLAVEVKEARTSLHSLDQQLQLAEFQLIRKGKRIPRNSNLLSLSPFFDDESNVFCVGRRLANSSYDSDKKFPVLIPRKLPINSFYFREAHERSFQCGPQMTFYTLRQTIWIPGGFELAKQVIHSCKPCIRQDARLLQPKMEDLRLDYCEPFNMKDSSGQEKKYMWLSLFALQLKQFTWKP